MSAETKWQRRTLIKSRNATRRGLNCGNKSQQTNHLDHHNPFNSINAAADPTKFFKSVLAFPVLEEWREGGACCLSFKGETRVSAAHFDAVLPGNAEAGITRGGNGNRRRKNKTGRSLRLMLGGGGRGLLCFLMSKCASALIRSGANLSEESARLFLITPRRIKIKSTGGFSRLSGALPQLRCQIGPLRHGSLLPDWLVNSHHQIPAPPRSAVRRLERTGSRGLAPAAATSSFCGKAFYPIVSVGGGS